MLPGFEGATEKSAHQHTRLVYPNGVRAAQRRDPTDRKVKKVLGFVSQFLLDLQINL